MSWGWKVWMWWPLLVGEVVAGQAGEDLEDPRGGGCGAAAVLGVDRKLLQFCGLHGSADLAFDERLDQHGDEVAAQQGFDAGRVVQEHRRDQLGALELGVAFLQVGLVLVGGQQLGAGHRGVVADQREAAVAGGVARDLVLVDGEADAVAGCG